MTTYADSGVDNDLGDDVSEIFYNALKKTWTNRKGLIGDVSSQFDNFRGTRMTEIGGLPKGTKLYEGVDGVGTKVEIAQRSVEHRTIAWDLFAMVCDDAVTHGAEPAHVDTIFDVNQLKNDAKVPYLDEVRQLAQGYIEAAHQARVAIVTGETAQLGSLVGGYGGFKYNWGAFVVGFARQDRMLTGHEIKKGDVLVGLREPGLRSNGLSLVRKTLAKEYGDQWHDHMWEGETLGLRALLAAKIYTRAAVDMFGGYDFTPKATVHGIAHITGGGLPGKLKTMLGASGLGATVSDPFVPSPLIMHIQEIGNVSDEEMYRTFNGGQGLVIATPSPQEVVNVASAYNIDSKIIGMVTKEQGIRIRSAGRHRTGDILTF